MDTLSDINNIDLTVFEELYQQYLSDPDGIDPSWKYFFKGFELAQTGSKKSPETDGFSASAMSAEFKVVNLINAYRERGHFFTKTNPVRHRREYSPTLDIENFALDASQFEQSFFAGNEIGIGKAKLSEIIQTLKQTYCQSFGVEFMFIRIPEIVSWLKLKMEGCKNTPSFTKEEKINLLKKIAQAVNFEQFIHTKFPGQKSFSLEGAESLIPALKAVINKGAELDYKEFIIGMPHRGRLNVLANILHKSTNEIFAEFEGKPFDEETLLGDVKYHLGYSSDYISNSGKKIHLTLSPNPSHLEAVSPVVEGLARAKNDRCPVDVINNVVPILIHGDASIAGQGIVYEVIQMSELQGYKTGGTIHLVVNNQLGFTTNYLDGRSSTYCTDVAKIIQSPIFHVNADDLEAVVYSILLAMEYREQFHKDVFIDLLGYRKYGHNESDEPRFTQPLLYMIIEKHPDPLKIYSSKLLEEGIITPEKISLYRKQLFDDLEKNLTTAKQMTRATIKPFLSNIWKDLKKADCNSFEVPTITSVDKELLLEIGNKLTALPPDKTFFRKVTKLQSDRENMLVSDKLDWAMGELLAYGSLLKQGIPVRISGQDVKRGTFSHRHAILTVEDSEEEYSPLKNISPDQAPFTIYNSLLSEYGVLGFEYGYALASPYALTTWEAQFGDFFNGAQIIIDQFMVSAEEKWNVFNGLVVLLPHGYEGQGPEHSSGRMERFLTMCADNNIQIANCTTPANFFHLLRRQVLRDFRKPLFVFTPKSLLRHPACVSSVNDLAEGGFKEVIDDSITDKDKVTRILFCTGKIFYDLSEEKKIRGRDDLALVRIEQLYPFPLTQIQNVLTSYPNVSEFYWVQEEPTNMGAAPFIRKRLGYLNPMIIARHESGSPATGSSQTHKLSQKKIIEKAFGECICENKDRECDMKCSLDLI
jgi:2-oxoglutarate dehydrogenase E1 component